MQQKNRMLLLQKQHKSSRRNVASTPAQLICGLPVIIPYFKESADEEDNEFIFNIDAPRKSKAKRNSEKLLISEHKLTEEEKEKCRSLVKHEVHAFLIETQTSNNMDPLMWWKAKHFNYPNVARVARNWLSVPATSTPSERVFYICGLVDTTKRSNLLGESIEKQVFLHNNIDEVELEQLFII